MRVSSLEISGFRGIRKIESLHFDPKLTVLVGDNGVGKTSILDALSILLDNYIARFLKGSPHAAERIDDADVNIDIKSSKIKLAISDDEYGRAAWTLIKLRREDKILNAKGSELEELNALGRELIHTIDIMCYISFALSFWRGDGYGSAFLAVG